MGIGQPTRNGRSNILLQAKELSSIYSIREVLMRIRICFIWDRGSGWYIFTWAHSNSTLFLQLACRLYWVNSLSRTYMRVHTQIHTHTHTHKHLTYIKALGMHRDPLTNPVLVQLILKCACQLKRVTTELVVPTHVMHQSVVLCVKKGSQKSRVKNIRTYSQAFPIHSFMEVKRNQSGHIINLKMCMQASTQNWTNADYIYKCMQKNKTKKKLLKTWTLTMYINVCKQTCWKDQS